MTLHRRLATVDRLEKWGIHTDQACSLCDSGNTETHDHLFFECPYLESLWQGLLRWMNFNRMLHNWEHEVQWLYDRVNNRNPRKSILGVVFAAVVYNIWMERNERRFRQSSMDAKIRARLIAQQAHITGRKMNKWKPTLQYLNCYPL